MGWFSFNSKILSFVFTNSLYSGVFAMVGGLVMFPTICLITQASKPENVNEKFSCIK